MQAIELEKEIVDDRVVKISNRRVVGSDASHNDDDFADADDVGKVLSVSRTRSGRMSRPPTQHDDEYQYRLATTSTSTSATQSAATSDVIVVKDVTPEERIKPEPVPVLKAKRKLSVSPRYRCRVCHKTYLGNFISV